MVFEDVGEKSDLKLLGTIMILSLTKRKIREKNFI